MREIFIAPRGSSRSTHLSLGFALSSGVMRIFGNGALETEGPYPDLTSRYLAGQWAMFRFSRGLFGNVALFSSDLSRPDMTGFRIRATDFLVTKYEIE